MRNLKKVLALVLALVMVIGLMTVASSAATTFDDVADVTAKYSEAVQVLGGLDVFQGKNTPGNFAPKDTITRAEVAAIIYRLATDKDSQNSIYASGTDFADVKADDWFSGYVCYCYNAQYMIGDKTNFYPYMQVTGYQALAMILRAIGFRENNDFQGPGWEIRAASTARELTILRNVSDAELVGPASRELVAEILFQAAIVPQVKYNSINGYTQYKETLINADSTKNDSLAWETFKLTSVAGADDWGRPGTRWFKDAEKDDVYDKAWDGGAAAGGKDVSVAFVKDAPVATYTNAVAECQIAEDASITTTKNYAVYVNGANIDAAYTVNATDENTRVGAAGRVTEVYDKRIVMVDTFLAVVTGMTAARFDAATHKIDPATVTLTVWDGHTFIDVYDRNGNVRPGGMDNKLCDVCGEAPADCTGTVTYTLTDRVHNNYTYLDGTTAAIGDYVLLNAYTIPDNTTANYPGTDANKSTATTSWGVYTGTAQLTTAAETAVATATRSSKYGEIQGKAVLKQDSQTTLWWNAKQHTLKAAGTVADSDKLYKNDAGSTKTIDFNWAFDNNGYLIGALELNTQHTYGVITKMYWAHTVADGATTDAGKAIAEVTYVNGDTATIPVSQITVQVDQDDSTEYTDVDNMQGATVYAPGGAADAMSLPTGTKQFYVASDATVNATADKAEADEGAGGPFDVIAGHLFQFTADGLGGYAALEVAGTGTANLAPNTGAKGHGAIDARHLWGTDGTKTISRNSFTFEGKVLTDSTVFLIRSGDGTAAKPYTWKSVTGYKNLPASSYTGPVDYVTDDSNTYVQCAYISGTASNEEYDFLFFYAGEAISQDINKNYVVPGWEDGKHVDLIVSPVDAADTAIDITEFVANHPYNFHKTDGVVVFAAGESPDDHDATAEITLNETAGTGEATMVYDHTDPGSSGIDNQEPYTTYMANGQDIYAVIVEGEAADTFINGIYADTDMASDGADAPTYYNLAGKIMMGENLLTVGANQADRSIVIVYAGTKTACEEVIYAGVWSTRTGAAVPGDATYTVKIDNSTAGKVCVSVESTDTTDNTTTVSYKLYRYSMNADKSTAVLVESVTGAKLTTGAYASTKINCGDDMNYYAVVTIGGTIVKTTDVVAGISD